MFLQQIWHEFKTFSILTLEFIKLIYLKFCGIRYFILLLIQTIKNKINITITNAPGWWNFYLIQLTKIDLVFVTGIEYSNIVILMSEKSWNTETIFLPGLTLD